MSPKASRLTTGVKLSYGMANFGFMLMIQFPNIYLLMFLTDVVGLIPASAGIVMTVANIIGVISVPILGPAIEKSNMKWGKYGSWILLAPFVILVSATLLFANFNFANPMTAVVVSTICFTIQAVSTNAVYIAYTSMNSYLASDGREAVSLATVRSQLGSVAKIIAGYTLLPMVYLFGGEKTMTSKGMLLTAFVTTLVCFLLFENLYRATRGMDAEATAKESVKASDMIKAAVTSRPLMLVLLAEIARVITIFMIMALFPFFFKYVVGDPTKASTFFGVTYILAFFGATIVPFLAKKISKRNIYAAGMLLFAAMMFAMFVFSDNPTFVIMLACVGYFGYSWGDTINTAILTDISDYTEYKTGASCRAVVFSVYQLAVKISAVVSSSISAFGLQLIGYKAGVEPTAEVVAGLKNLSMFLPAALLVISAVCMFLYNISEKQMPEIREALAQRRASAEIAE